MIVRMLIAIVGALVITTGLLLSMDAVTSAFRERSTTKMYRISDVVRRDRSGRPDRPEPPTRLPALPATEPAATGDAGVGAAAPDAPSTRLSRPRVLLDLDPDAAEPASDN
jgi:hypothetical protein